jgi:predicted molibdopterin-dependent oxidoreductase YjgC
MFQFTLNGKKLEVPEGITVLEAARQAGITIPTLCDHPDLEPYGGCRLCVVEVEGARYPATACNLPVTQGMQVRTETPALVSSRRAILEMLLSDYHNAGYQVERANTQFLHWVNYYGLDAKEKMAAAPRYTVNSDPHPLVWVDFNKCILCMRCIRACEEVQGRFVWHLAGRGEEAHIVAGAGTDMLSARCESCGACVAYCPTGALDNKMSVMLGEPDRKVTTICTFCGVGCTLDLNIKDDQIIRVTSNPKAPVNGMHLCVKGRYGYDFVHHPDRLTRPRVRRYLLEGTPRPQGRGEWVEVDWDTALDLAASRLRQARDQYGPQAVGVMTSAKCTNEENYLMNKFARQVIGTNSIDHCARL